MCDFNEDKNDAASRRARYEFNEAAGHTAASVISYEVRCTWRRSTRHHGLHSRAQQPAAVVLYLGCPANWKILRARRCPADMPAECNDFLRAIRSRVRAAQDSLCARRSSRPIRVPAGFFGYCARNRVHAPARRLLCVDNCSLNVSPGFELVSAEESSAKMIFVGDIA